MERVINAETAINNAEFSIKMEGMSVGGECKILCEKLLKKEVTFDDYIKAVKKMQELDD